MNWYCKKCKKELKKIYRLNLVYRDPNTIYKSGTVFMQTENYQYCKKHFLEIRKLISKII